MVHVHGRSAATLAGPRPRPSGQIRPHVAAWAVVRGPEWAGCGPGDLQGRWAAAGAGRGRLAPPRADHRPPRRLRWPISPSRPGYPGSPGGRWLRLAASRSWGFWVGDTIAGNPGYGVANSEAPTPAGGQTHPTASWTPGVPGPAGRNGPSEAPRRPMVGPGRCLAGPKGARPLPTDPMGPLGPCRAHRPAPVAGRALTGARIGRFALWGRGRHPPRSAMYVYHATDPGA